MLKHLIKAPKSSGKDNFVFKKVIYRAPNELSILVVTILVVTIVRFLMFFQ